MYRKALERERERELHFRNNGQIIVYLYYLFFTIRLFTIYGYNNFKNYFDIYSYTEYTMFRYYKVWYCSVQRLIENEYKDTSKIMYTINFEYDLMIKHYSLYRGMHKQLIQYGFEYTTVRSRCI